MDYEVLVNKENFLSDNYIPSDLVEIDEPTGVKLDSTYVNMLDRHVYDEFKEMQKAALEFGYEVFIDSSYRSYEYQEQVFISIARNKGIDYAIKYCAVPGCSEHQTGFALDTILRRNGSLVEESHEDDPEMIWLRENCYKYGFILRYPKGKEDITGYNFEPWHFRYVGRKAAKEMYDRGISTLEEYVKLKEKKFSR